MSSADRTLADALLPGARLEVRDLDGPTEIQAFGGRWRTSGGVSVLSATGAATVEGRLPDGAVAAVSRRVGRGRIVFAGWQPWDAPEHDAERFAGSKGLAEAVAARFARAAPEPGDPSEQVEVNVFRDGIVEHLFVLNRSGEPRTVRAGRATVRLAGHGAAELMLARDQIAAAYLDGANDLDPERSTPPRVAVGRCSLSAAAPADLLALGRRTGLAYASGGARIVDRRDYRRPRSRIRALRLTRRGLVLRGRARDRGCAGRPRALVTVGRRSGRRCRFLTRSGRLSRLRSCRRPVRLTARGGRRFRIRRRARLPRGVYLVRVRARDAAGNVERGGGRRNGARVRVR